MTAGIQDTGPARSNETGSRFAHGDAVTSVQTVSCPDVAGYTLAIVTMHTAPHSRSDTSPFCCGKVAREPESGWSITSERQ